MLRLLYALVVVLCVLPTVPGVLGVVSSSLSYIPPLGMDSLSFTGFKQVFAWNGVWQSIGLTLFSAIVSSYLACVLAFAILQRCWNTRWWQKIELSLSPLLSIPHVAFAIGFAFLFDPTGLGVRLIHALFGYDLNQSTGHELALLIHDPYALGLIIMLAIKEVPFLLLMSIPILKQLNIDKTEKITASMGYSRAHAWWKSLFVQWLVKLRFPMLAVLAYSLSVVDVALIVGPTNPPTFAVLVWQWFNDPDLTLLPRASAGAIVLFIIATLIIAFARTVEWLVTKGFRGWQISGRRGVMLPGRGLFSGMILLTGAMLPLMLVWSFAQRWRFPDIAPSRYSARFWEYEWSGIVSTIEQSLSLALVSGTVAVVLALIAHEYRIRHRWQVPGYVIAIPMLIPQLSILFGLQITTLFIGGNAHWLWVCWAHMFFAFPFVYLSLDGPWRSYNEAMTRVALSLGKTPLSVFLKVKLPQVFPAILFAWAIGISVSLSQYLPTLILGAGRISTLTTEAVALSSGFDRRVTAIYALWQALLPLIFFFIAILGSRMQVRYRRSKFKGLQSNESVSKKSHSS
ncbi:ABC transporter permease [Vibrio breoganii]|uniref:ABC transporter permease n=1 Tax=Vibrio breoganii TaxID=553239 RepID=UPI00080E5AA2|nr:thiamine ABC transporter permease [Vibrio breoganii]MDN3717073.1 thiamine ABC transporter permease [Vibrio breoganii]OCH76806.1 thiamine ABC transporter permease [Vibrio breoganii]PMK38769.1 thiamine ABC transporter permease [Vibrio breoganii]PMM82793.1 thiamine ABC transporter permease [Vibrio breoganii]PMO55917.1 thiamine ABC transporter permease [Vibrio breoganii]